MATIAEKVASIVNYYANLLIIQYHNKTKAKANVEELVNESLGDGLSFSLERAFDIDTAVGPALTSLGKYVGVPRTVYGFGVTRVYFEFADYSTPDLTGFRGFRTYDFNPEPGTYFWSYTLEAQVEYELTDAELRFLINLKIQVNTTRATYSEIKRIAFENFPDDFQVFDNKDMTLTYISSLTVSQLALLALTQGFLPVPACVGVSYFQVEYPLQLFGFLSYTDQDTVSQGFSQYGTIEQGSFLSYANNVIV
ncbi:DUF2612 domain-containing protein [Candidatus Pacearchaeota archaeon]|nr:DUF2612 domain-containing protein [Candidatus Pacearchaeota archaeon]